MHGICNELQGLLDTTTAALADRTQECELYVRHSLFENDNDTAFRSVQRILDLEAHLDDVIKERESLRSQISTLGSSQRQPSPPPLAPSPPIPSSLSESESKRYAEFIRRLEVQFRNSQQQLESITAEKMRVEGLYRYYPLSSLNKILTNLSGIASRMRGLTSHSSQL